MITYLVCVTLLNTGLNTANRCIDIVKNKQTTPPKQAKQAQAQDFTLLNWQPPPLLWFAPLQLAESKTRALERAGHKQFGPEPEHTLGHRAKVQKPGPVVFRKTDTALSLLFLFFLVKLN